jgi:hypothetical protein
MVLSTVPVGREGHQHTRAIETSSGRGSAPCRISAIAPNSAPRTLHTRPVQSSTPTLPLKSRFPRFPAVLRASHVLRNRYRAGSPLLRLSAKNLHCGGYDEGVATHVEKDVFDVKSMRSHNAVQPENVRSGSCKGYESTPTATDCQCPTTQTPVIGVDATRSSCRR